MTGPRSPSQSCGSSRSPSAPSWCSSGSHAPSQIYWHSRRGRTAIPPGTCEGFPAPATTATSPVHTWASCSASTTKGIPTRGHAQAPAALSGGTILWRSHPPVGRCNYEHRVDDVGEIPQRDNGNCFAHQMRRSRRIGSGAPGKVSARCSAVPAYPWESQDSTLSFTASLRHGINTSVTTVWITTATGSATRAPRMPIAAPPRRTALRTMMAGISV